MLFFVFPQTRAARNLATEEFFFMHRLEPCFLLWRNRSAVIVGRNQNTLAEIDDRYVREHRIDVVRRLTGGGAVFHDLGNVNYTFISRDLPGADIDFVSFTAPILQALESLGVHAELNGRNDLCIDGLKFSGSAQTRNAHGTLHHGTLLFSSRVENLSGALRVDPRKIQSKGIASVASRVTNLSDHLSRPLSVTDFIDYIASYVCAGFPSAEPYTLTDEDNAVIDRLDREKYSTWAWNYGESPAYTHRKSARFDCGTLEALLNVKDGRILSVKLQGDFFGTRDIAELEESLRGCLHEREALRARIDPLSLNACVFGLQVEQLLEILI